MVFPRHKTMTSQQCDWSLAMLNLNFNNPGTAPTRGYHIVLLSAAHAKQVLVE